MLEALSFAGLGPGTFNVSPEFVIKLVPFVIVRKFVVEGPLPWFLPASSEDAGPFLVIHTTALNFCQFGFGQRIEVHFYEVRAESEATHLYHLSRLCSKTGRVCLRPYKWEEGEPVVKTTRDLLLRSAVG